MLNETQFQQGHLVSSVTILLCLQVSRKIRPQIKLVISLVIADDCFDLFQGLCEHVGNNILTLSPTEGTRLF